MLTIKIKINVKDNEDILSKIEKKIKTKVLSYEIIKRSIDARNKNDIYYLYEIDFKVENENKILNKYSDITKIDRPKYEVKVTGKEKLKERIIIVGAGPCGLFSAYILSSLGYKPLIIERGDNIDIRKEKVLEFWKNNKLDLESNVQFGEGGAGTFSDGKLNTMIKDTSGRIKKVLEIFVENGAPKEILYVNNPHIGTDLLQEIIKNIRNKIISMGGEFRFNTKLTDLKIENNELVGICVNNNEYLSCNNLILAIGHSSRDTYLMLKNYLKMENKPFAVGLRIEHKQDMINKSQYGDNYKYLENASYKLTYQTKSHRGVYTFCMCPGGYVVNASSFKDQLVVNGMSNYKRDSENANSAVIVTINEKDYGNELLAGMYYQEKLEKCAYELGNGLIPISLYKDYKENKVSTSFKSVNPIFKGNYVFANLNNLFSKEINVSIKEGIENFGTKIKGFNNPDAILAGVEARTSSPVRILRNEKMLSNINGIYPSGEGAGFAGGITSSAVDGLKVAEIIASEYSV